MSKAITGIAELGAVAGVFAADFLSGGLLTPLVVAITPELMGLAASGVAMEAGAIADALTQNRGMNITTRQPASPRQIIYGTQRAGGTIIYQSTTGSHKDQYNFIIAIATHEIHAIENLYLDGRRVFWQSGSTGNTTRNGYNFGGQAASGQHTAPNGQKYDFGGKVYCEARYGDQAAGDVIGGMTANDPNWAAGTNGSPWVGGCTYVYLKIEYDPGTFPQLPEIKFTVHGKNDIFDPRTGTRGYSSNPALIAADILTDTIWGAGDNTVNENQLIAAANICDEQVSFAGGGGGSESRYACHWHYDTTTAVGDALTTVLASCGGRLSRIGGEWYIWPAAWTSPSSLVNANADQSLFVDSFQWTPKKSLPDLYNRINGTYTAPNYPFNAAGDLYDSNGWYEGSIQNNFPFAFQPTNFPQYAADELHGYGTGVDVYLSQDGGVELPYELNLPCVLSVSQAQRLAKIALLRNRQQGSATMALSLAALQLQPTDVVQFNYAPYGWVNKYFEVQKLTLHTDYGNGAPRTFVKVKMGETDPSVYEWSEAEELTVYDVPSAPGAVPYIVDPPTNLAIEDDATTASVLSDGTSTPRMLVSWTPPEDTYVNNGGKIEVRYQFSTLNTSQNGGISPIRPLVLSPTQQADGSWISLWVDAGSVSGQSTYMYVDGISPTQYQNITVQVRAVRSGGATSDWVQVANALPVKIISFPVGPVGIGPIFKFPDGKTLDTLEPLEAGADVTANHTAADTSNVNGVSSTVVSLNSTGQQRNLIPDSDFKFGSTYWNLSAGPVAATIEDGVGASGGRALAVLGNGTSFFSFPASSIITVVPGQTYTLSGYIDATSVTGSAQPHWAVFDPAITTSYNGDALSNPGSKGRVSKSFTVPAGVTKVVVLADTGGATIANGQKLYFSEPQLEVGNVATAYKSDVPAHTGVVLLQNPNFEAGDVGWTPTGNITPGGGFLGSGYSAKCNQTGTYVLTNNQKIPCAAGAVISATALYSAPVGTAGQARIRIMFSDAAGNVTNYQEWGDLTPTESPQQVRGTLVAAANTAYAQILFVIFNAAPGWTMGGVTASILPNSVDEVPDGSTYLRMPGSNMDQNRRAIIDFGQGAHLNKNLDNIAPGPSGRRAVQTFAVSNGASTEWMLLGTWVFGSPGSLTLTYHGGTGYNTNAGQEAVTTITVRSGNGTQAPNISGVTYYTQGGSDPILGVIANATNGSTSPSNNSWDIWINWNTFANGHVEIALSPNDTFTYNGGIGGSAPNGQTAWVGVGGRVFGYGGTGLDAVLDGLDRFAAAEAGANVTDEHVITSQVKLGVASTLTSGQWVAANGLAWTAQTAFSTDVYNVQGVGSINIGGTAGTGMVRFGVFVDGNTSGTNYGSGFIYVSMPTNAQVTASGAYFGSITGLTPGTHTIQVYVWNNTTQSATITDGYAICQRIF